MLNFFRPALIKLVLRGRQNWDEEQARDLVQRKPVTLTVLKLIKLLLESSHHTEKERALVWSVCTLAFCGAFRGEHFFPWVLIYKEVVQD